MTSRAGSIFALLALTACGEDFAELIVEVDADDGLVGAVERVAVEVSDGRSTLDRFEVALTGIKPACLPFSIGVAPNAGNDEATLDLVVRADVGRETITQTIATRFLPGTHRVPVLLDRACLDACAKKELLDPPEVVDRTALMNAMNSAPCRAPIDLEQCLDRGGCATSSTAANICAEPCPSVELEPLTPPASPIALTPPAITCAPGWSPEAGADTDGIALCEPWPANGFFGCARGEARFPGTAACTPIGPPCPSGDFAAVLPANDVFYVSSTATITGDGSRDAPLRTLDEALAIAPAGATIALSTGAHLIDPSALDRPLTLAGACAGATELLRAGASLGPLFTVTSSSVFVRDLTISGADRAISVVGGVVHLDGAQLESSAGSAVVAGGPSSIVLRSVVISGAGDTAIVLESGGHASIDAIFVDGARGGAIRVSGGGAVLRMRDAAIRSVSRSAGVIVENGGHAELARSLLENVEAYGVYGTGAGTYLELEDVLVRDLAPAANGTLGHGVHVQDSAQASLLRVGIARARHSALEVARAGPVILADVVVHDTLPQAANLEHGYAIGCDGCTLRGGRISLARATRNALDLDNGADVELADLAIRDTRPDENDRSIATGLVASRGTRLVLARAIFERVRLAGIFLQEDTTAELSDLIVRDTLPEEASGYGGHGAFVKNGVHFEVKRAIFERNRHSGITVLTGPALSNIELEDTVIRETTPSGVDPSSGRGILVAPTGPSDLSLDLALRRVALEDNIGAAIEATRAIIDASDVAIDRPRAGHGWLLHELTELEAERIAIEAPEGACLDLQGMATLRGASCASANTDGWIARSGSSLLARDFRVGGSIDSGVRIEEDASVDLFDGELSENASGVSMPDAYDLARVAVRVRYFGNGENVRRAP